MKDRKWMALPLAVLILVLAACGNRAEEVTAMEDEQVPDVSAGDLLVDSLEYLLDEEGTEKEEQSVSTEEPDEEEEQSQIEVTIYYGNGASDEYGNIHYGTDLGRESDRCTGAAQYRIFGNEGVFF